MLNRVTRLGGTMLLESTSTPRRRGRPLSVAARRAAKAKAVPSIAALRMQLAWTGWRKTRRFTDYRPGTTEALFLCEKTDELDEGTGLAPAVSAHRPGVSAR